MSVMSLTMKTIESKLKKITQEEKKPSRSFMQEEHISSSSPTKGKDRYSLALPWENSPKIMKPISTSRNLL